MPFIGVEVKDEYPKKHREALLRELNEDHELAKLLLKEFKLKSFDYTLRRKAYTGDYSLEVLGNDGAYHAVAKFGMLPMPGCSAICILHHAVVEEHLRRQGIGDHLLKTRLAAAKALGYSAVICTVRTDNCTEINLLAKNGVNYITGYLKPDRTIQVRWKNL